MKTPRYLPVLLATFLMLAGLGNVGVAADKTLAIVVSRDTAKAIKTKHLTRRMLRKIYRRQQLLWKNGDRVHALNLRATDPLRAAFTQSLFHQSVEQMATYWNERYFDGVSPPHVVDSQEAVLRFVTRIPGAIGYIAACRVDDRVEVLMTLPIDTPQTSLACR